MCIIIIMQSLMAYAFIEPNMCIHDETGAVAAENINMR